MQPLLSALSPAHFRFGGTASDCLVFRENLTSPAYGNSLCGPEPHSFNFTGDRLDTLYAFVKDAGLNFIFNVNLFIRNDSNSSFDPSNAKQLLDYASARHYSMDFELGNEPDGNYKRGFHVNGTQIGQDYGTFRNLLNSYPIYKNSKLVGIDLAWTANNFSLDMFTDFLKAGGGQQINAMTFHQYYMDCSTSRLEQFLDPRQMDNMERFIKVEQQFNLTLWLGETASCWADTNNSLSLSFASGFLWLDELGLGAKTGLDVVIRQELRSAVDGLLDFSTYQPKPDYWISFLHKKLVGQKVLNVTITPNNNTFLRMYAAPHTNGNDLVVYGQLSSSEFSIVDFPAVSRQITAYILTPGEPRNLASETVNIFKALRPHCQFKSLHIAYSSLC
uniref:Glycoside hydrolase family 79 protein n=1 Tax=Acrobeloides nanus TaxID=290746 RepID=A0A914CLS8_9BILA